MHSKDVLLFGVLSTLCYALTEVEFQSQPCVVPLYATQQYGTVSAAFVVSWPHLPEIDQGNAWHFCCACPHCRMHSEA
jgi:hypothetical protein